MTELNTLDEQIDALLDWLAKMHSTKPKGWNDEMVTSKAKAKLKTLFTEHSKEIRENAYIEAEAEIFKDERNRDSKQYVKDIEQATQEIIDLIESIIPEPDKHTWRAYGQPDGTVVCDHCNLAEDVNNLLSSQVADIKSKLIDGSEK